MLEIKEADALRIIREYYGKFFTEKGVADVVSMLSKLDIVGLIIEVYKQGVSDTLAECNQ